MSYYRNKIKLENFKKIIEEDAKNYYKTTQNDETIKKFIDELSKYSVYYRVLHDKTLSREILEKKRNGEIISREERETMKFIATLSTTRKDKMLDRMALMPRDAVSADEILSRFSAISLEVEDDAIDIEPSEASND